MRRRRRIRWGRPFKKLRYADHSLLHDFEDDVILRKVRALETPRKGLWVFTANALMNTYPDLFIEKNLYRALKRMSRQGTLRRPRKWGKNPIYELDDRPAEAEQAA